MRIWLLLIVITASMMLGAGIMVRLMLHFAPPCVPGQEPAIACWR